MLEVLTWIENTGIATEIRSSALWFPWIEGVHVVAVTLVFGAVAIVDARLVGLFSRNEAVSTLSEDLLPLVWTAFGLAALTGLLMFSATATKYAGNIYFEIKMSLILLAGINMAAFHAVTYKDVALWDNLIPPPLAVRIAGLVSLAIWIAVMGLGRYIGFSLN